MAVNKVVYDGDTLIDLTNDTVTPATLAEGETAHAASGEMIVGAMPRFDVDAYYTKEEIEAKLANVECVYVTDFGAVGDGVTDDTQSFVNAINSANGRAIVVPNGKYRIDNIDVIGKSFKMVGVNAPVLQLKTTVDYHGIFRIRNANGIEFSGLVFDGDRLSVGESLNLSCIWCYDCKNVIIHNNIFQNVSREATTFYGATENVHIYSNIFRNTSCLSWYTKGTINRMTFENNSAEKGRTYAIEIDTVYGGGSSDVVIRNNTFTDFASPVLSLNNVDNVIVDGNITHDCPDFCKIGMPLYDTDMQETMEYDPSIMCKNVQITNNVATECGYTFFTSLVTQNGVYNYDGLVIRNNRFRGANGVRVRCAKNVVIESNVANVTGRFLELVSTNDVRVINNFCKTTDTSYAIDLRNAGDVVIDGGVYESTCPLYGVTGADILSLKLYNVKACLSNISQFSKYDRYHIMASDGCINLDASTPFYTTISGSSLYLPVFGDAFNANSGTAAADFTVDNIVGNSLDGREIALYLNNCSLALNCKSGGNIITLGGVGTSEAYPPNSIIRLIKISDKWHVSSVYALTPMVNSITAAKTKMNYGVGDVLNTDDIVVTAHYNNGTSKMVTDYTIDISGVKMNTAGSYNIIISYEGKTANIGISVTATATYTNQIPISTNGSGGIFNGTGYMASKRLSSDGSGEAWLEGSPTNPVFVTGYIPVKHGDIIRLKNCYIDVDGINGAKDASLDKPYYGYAAKDLKNWYYDSNKQTASSANWTIMNNGGNNLAQYKSCVIDADGHISQFTMDIDGVSNPGYLRLVLGGDPTTAIVTVNEEIE